MCTFPGIILQFLLVIVAIPQLVQSIRFCVVCDATSPIICKAGTGKCSSQNCIDSMERCQRHDDLCLASWRHTDDGPVMVAGCFPLPPLSKRDEFNKHCKPRQRNGTYTCLCRRNGCNKYPLRKPVIRRYQATTSMAPSGGTAGILHTVQSVSTESSLKMSMTSIVFAWIVIVCATSIVLSAMYFSRIKCHPRNVHKDVLVFQLPTSSDQKEHSILPILEQVISEGRFSTVWRGKLNEDDVAVKCFPLNQEMLWCNECSIYSKSPGHENVLKFISGSTSIDNTISAQVWLATELCGQGSLKEYLKSHILTWNRLLAMARGISTGLSYLHSDYLPGEKPKAAIAHQDLKSDNILVRQNGTCVLADFGLSMDLSQDFISQVYRNGQVGTLRYMAPEKLEARIDIDNPESFKQIDVYSLSLVLWELLSRCQMPEKPGDPCCLCSEYTLPFEDLAGCNPTLQQMTAIVVVNGSRPCLPTALTNHSQNDVTMDCLWTTIQDCWDKDPDARLTAECVTTRLSAMT